MASTKSKSAASPEAVKRLKKELRILLQKPTPGILALPNSADILEWHYVVEGPKDSVYEGGFYHGILRFPSNYPFRPPSIMMLTPNGRFQTNTRLCMSMTDFHPESWNPLWRVSTIVSGLVSFMLDTQSTYGSIVTSNAARRDLAAKSLAFNVKDKNFKTLFPELVELNAKRQLEETKASEKKNSKLDHAENKSKRAATSTLATPGSSWRDRIVDLLTVAVLGVVVSYLFSVLY